MPRGKKRKKELSDGGECGERPIVEKGACMKSYDIKLIRSRGGDAWKWKVNSHAMGKRDCVVLTRCRKVGVCQAQIV